MSDEPNANDAETETDEPEVTASTFDALDEAGLLDDAEPAVQSDPDAGVDEQIRELVFYVVQSILPEVEEIELELTKEPSEWTVGVHVPADFRGRVIGRHGRVARSIRNIVDAADFETHRRISVDIVD
jgi:predicted RNA-binding protein YlqC (UPF0109 family)